LACALRELLPPSKPEVFGVGQVFCDAIVFRLGLPLIHAPVISHLPFVPADEAVGVGTHKPEPVSLVRRSNVGSSQHCPAAVIPERGQVIEDSSESPSNEGWAVFHEDETGSNLAHDPRHVCPHS
jgi:hypothetical protein